MSKGTRSRPRPWCAGTIGTVFELVIPDGGSKPMPLSASEKNKGDSAWEERAGAEGDDAILARVGLVGVVESPAE